MQAPRLADSFQHPVRLIGLSAWTIDTSIGTYEPFLSPLRLSLQTGEGRAGGAERSSALLARKPTASHQFSLAWPRARRTVVFPLQLRSKFISDKAPWPLLSIRS
jgi:hypothetical protein